MCKAQHTHSVNQILILARLSPCSIVTAHIQRNQFSFYFPRQEDAERQVSLMPMSSRRTSKDTRMMTCLRLKSWSWSSSHLNYILNISNFVVEFCFRNPTDMLYTFLHLKNYWIPTGNGVASGRGEEDTYPSPKNTHFFLSHNIVPTGPHLHANCLKYHFETLESLLLEIKQKKKK